MAKEKQNFSLYQGDDKTLRFTVTDKDGTPLVVTGALIEWGCSSSLKETPLLTKISTDSAQIEIDPQDNTAFFVYLDKSETIDLPAKVLFHHARITLSNKRETIEEGHLTVNPTVFQEPAA